MWLVWKNWLYGVVATCPIKILSLSAGWRPQLLYSSSVYIAKYINITSTVFVLIGASLSEPHLVSATGVLSVYLFIYL